MSNTSSAYDLSLYTSAAPKLREKPQLRVTGKNGKRAWSAAFTPKAISSFVIVVTLFSLMIYNQVKLTEVTGQINMLQQELEALESENTRIESQLDAMISLHTIGERARDELGLDRVNKYQTKYVYLYGEDRIILAETPEETGIVEKAKLIAASIINGMKEYIGTD